MLKKLVISVAAIVSVAIIYFVIVPAFTGRLFISPVVDLGVLTLRWYGLIMASSVLVGYLVCRKYSWRFGIAEAEVDNFAFWLVIVSFLGARLYHVLFAWSYYSENLGETIKIWHGGLSIYGALFFGLVFTWFWSRGKAYSFKQLLDLVVVSLPLAQALGRWGNFVNQEAYGWPTNLPWRLYVDPEFRPRAFMGYSYFHPTFLYESLLLVIVFIILQKLIGKLRPGVLGFSYLCLYSIIRFFIEPLRLDSVWVGDFRADQVVALVAIMISGIFILHWQFAKSSRAKVV